jgi:RNA methyltransferase, TrmH family
MKTEFLDISQAQLKIWARLDDNKFRHGEGIFLAEGVKVVEELLSSDWQTEAILVLPEKIKYWEKLVEKAATSIPIYSLTDLQLKKLSQDKEPEGIVAVAQIKPEPTLISILSTSP